MVWSNFTATKCRGLVSLNQVIKEIICLQPLKRGDLCLVLLLAVLLLLLLVAPCLNCLEAVKKPPPVAFKVMCLDRKSGSAGMPRPISYAVFCLKKKNNAGDQRGSSHGLTSHRERR